MKTSRYRAVGAIVLALMAMAGIFSLGFARFGISEPQWNREVVVRWLLRHGVNMIVIATGAVIVIRVLQLAIEQLRLKIGRSHTTTDLEWQRRAATITRLLESLVSVSIGFVGTHGDKAKPTRFRLNGMPCQVV